MSANSFEVKPHERYVIVVETPRPMAASDLNYISEKIREQIDEWWKSGRKFHVITHHGGKIELHRADDGTD